MPKPEQVARMQNIIDSYCIKTFKVAKDRLYLDPNTVVGGWG